MLLYKSSCTISSVKISLHPASSISVGADSEGESFDEEREYASIVGMLMYLANNLCPDIAYATHQAARFTHATRKSHPLAVKKIQYLQGTKDKGLIMNPTSYLSIGCYVDADFARLHGKENDEDPISVKSRAGYVLSLANCPVLWVSRLQTVIASSTMEAEYVALSQAMKDLIPLHRFCTLVCDVIFGKGKYLDKMFSRVFEDNNGALQLAHAPCMTPHTKHFGIKYNFFCEICKLNTGWRRF
jgi:hypothetical protein